MSRTNVIDAANIALMLAALALACLIPVKTFVLAYAVLGPLHYLTEISWLRERKFFLPRKRDLWVLFSCMAAVLGFQELLIARPAPGPLQAAFPVLLFLAFFACLVMVAATGERARRMGWLLLPFGALVLFAGPLQILFSVFLVTLVHVYVFTGMFMLSGALKTGEKSALLALGVFLACPVLCFLFPLEWSAPPSAPETQSYVLAAGAINLAALKEYFGVWLESERQMFELPLSILFTRVVAFAYLYHYLNWFSKTSIIRWHEISLSRAFGIAVLWAASVALYMHDYALGFRWLLALSLGHVVLEFPLNHQSFLHVGRAAKRALTAR